MDEMRQQRMSLGLIAGFFGVILAAVCGLAALPAQAHAADAGIGENVGGLIFNYTTGPGVTTTTIQNDPSNGIITIEGDADLTVTQVEVAQGTKATGLWLGSSSGRNYTGTITLNGVKLTGADNQNVINFGNGAGDQGCTLVLGPGTTIQANPGLSTSTWAAISLNSQTDDTLVLQDGSAVTINPDLTGKIPAAIYVSGESTQTIEFEGDAVVSGGAQNDSGAAANYSGAIVCQSTGAGNLIIEVDEGAEPTVTGAPGAPTTSYPMPALLVNPAKTNASDVSTVTIEGPGTLNLVGGQANNSGSGASAAGMVLDIGTQSVGGTTYGAPTVSIDGPGVVVAQGGPGYDDNTTGAGGAGGPGVLVDADGNGSATINVNAGTLTALGGNGGASSTQGAGDGGNGITLNGATGTGNPTGSLFVTGGTVLAQGGSIGSSGNLTSNPKPGYGIQGQATYTSVNIENWSETEDGPTVSALGGSNKNAAGTSSNSATAFYGLNDNALLVDASELDSISEPYFYPFIAVQGSGQNTAETPASLVCFAGAATNISGTFSTTYELGTDLDDQAFALITPAPIESISAGVISNAGTTAQSYVMAQTPNTMTGISPMQARTYRPTVSAVFSGIENVDTGNFGTLAGFSVQDLSATVEPSEDVSTTNAPAGYFYVEQDATASQLTVTPQETVTIPSMLSQYYPNLTSVSEAQVPVVYTIDVVNTSGANKGTVYTNPDGSGNLVKGTPNSGNYALNAGYTVIDAIVDASYTTGENPGVDLLTGPDPVSYFLGLYIEQPASMPENWTLINNNQVTGWSNNATLVAETYEGYDFDLLSILPSPTYLDQGGTVDITATFNVTPSNNKLPYYSLYDAGLSALWNGVFVNTGNGNIQSNGLTLEQTDGTTDDSIENGVFTITSQLTVSANTMADVGHYRVWPWLGNTGNPAANPPTGQYAIIQVVAANMPEGAVQVARVFNPFSLEHLYTTDANEVNTLVAAGWDDENVAWVAPSVSDTPIYRLYNPNNGDHMYTISENEYNTLIGAGWTGEGEKLYSAPNTGEEIYRLYNPYMTENEGAYAHLWTGDYNEYVTLGGLGWQQESVAFWAYSVPLPL